MFKVIYENFLAGSLSDRIIRSRSEGYSPSERRFCRWKTCCHDIVSALDANGSLITAKIPRLGHCTKLLLSGPFMAAAGRRCCPLLLVLRLLLQVLHSSATGIASYTFSPPSLTNLTENGNETVVVSVKMPSNQWEKASDTPWNLILDSFHPEVALPDSFIQLRKSEFVNDNQSSSYIYNASFTVFGRSLGKTGLRVRLVTADTWDETDDWWKPGFDSLPPRSPEVLDVAVRRDASSERLTKYFVVSVVLLVITGNIMMGCELDVDVVMQTIKRPVAPAIGFLAQSLIMPLLAYTIAKSIFVPRGLYSMALGLFITGCSPGGGASNFWTLLLGGNVNLSVTMTFVSTLSSLVMMPLWIGLLGVEFLQGFSTQTKIHVPYANISRSLASLVLPLLLGVAIQKWRPTWAAKSRKCMRPFIIFVLIFVVCFGAISNWYMFRMMTWPALIGGLMLPWCGFMFGCFTSIILRRAPGDVTAIAIETGIQNTGIAILMLKASFAQPDADIGAVLPVIVACFTPAPLLMGAGVHSVIKRLKSKRQTNLDVEKPCGVAVSLELPESASSNLLVDPSKLESQGFAAPLAQ